MPSDTHSEQPIEPEIFKMLEKFTVPYLDHKLVLKKEASQTRYFNERNQVSYEDFAGFLSSVVSDYIECKLYVKKHAREYNSYWRPLSGQLSIKESDAQWDANVLYGKWREKLEDVSRDLLRAIQFAYAHRLPDEGLDKQIETLSEGNKELQRKLQEANQRIAALEAYMRLRGLNPDDASDTLAGDVDT